MKLRHSCDQFDIQNKMKFRYYEVNSNKFIKVNNQYPCSLFCEEIGKEIDIIIEDTHKNDLIIKLSYDGEKYSFVRIKKEDLAITRLTLVCCGFNSNYGNTWYIKKYNGNIILE